MNASKGLTKFQLVYEREQVKYVHKVECVNAPMHNTSSHLFSISYISFVDAITFCVFLCAVDFRRNVAHILHYQD